MDDISEGLETRGPKTGDGPAPPGPRFGPPANKAAVSTPRPR